MALVTDKRDCLLTLILDIESLFLNLNSYSQIRSSLLMGGSQSLSKEVLSNKPLFPPLKNLLVTIEIPDRSVLFV